MAGFSDDEANDGNDETDLQEVLSTVEACATYLEGMCIATAGDERIARLNDLIGEAAIEARHQAASLKREQQPEDPD